MSKYRSESEIVRELLSKYTFIEHEEELIGKTIKDGYIGWDGLYLKFADDTFTYFTNYVDRDGDTIFYFTEPQTIGDFYLASAITEKECNKYEEEIGKFEKNKRIKNKENQAKAILTDKKLKAEIIKQLEKE